MASNDFHSVNAVLAPELIVEWPQSGERIRGAERFCRMNADYPTTSRWRFQINRLVASGESVVTQVSVTDGVQSAEPVSFFTVEAGKIILLVEYWPEPFAPAENRRHLVEQMHGASVDATQDTLPMPHHPPLETRSYVGIGLCLGVAIGAGLGVALGNLALGMGPGIAVGAALGLMAARRARSKPTGSDPSRKA